jgi:hypothetical protein
VEYTENADCMSHYSFAELISVPIASQEMTLAQLHQRAQHDLNSRNVTLEFSRDVIHKLVCPSCGSEEEKFSAVGTVAYAHGRCPADGQMRAVITMHSYSGTEAYGNRTLDQLGLPLFDVFTARSDEREVAYLMAGDQKAVLGQLATGAAH